MTRRPADLGHLVRPPHPTPWMPTRFPGTTLAELRGQPPPHRFGPPPLQRDTPLIMPDLATLARVLEGLRNL